MNLIKISFGHSWVSVMSKTNLSTYGKLTPTVIGKLFCASKIIQRLTRKKGLENSKISPSSID